MLILDSQLTPDVKSSDHFQNIRIKNKLNSFIPYFTFYKYTMQIHNKNIKTIHSHCTTVQFMENESIDKIYKKK
jgi:hypothetical protein